MHGSTGSAIYVYGSVDAGIEYTWTLGSNGWINGTANGNLLIMVDDINHGIHFPPYSQFLRIEITQFISGARFQFNKADIVVGTGMTG